MPRINIFENFPKLHIQINASSLSNGTLRIHQIYIPGSISFNNIAMIFSASGTTAKTFTLSFGLYSLSGSTLSLANSASVSSNPGANALSWITLATSATQDITPGNWFFGLIFSSSSNSLIGILCPPSPGGGAFQSAYSGPFQWGQYNTSTSVLPASIATSDLSKANAGGDIQAHPYIVISA